MLSVEKSHFRSRRNRSDHPETADSQQTIPYHDPEFLFLYNDYEQYMTHLGVHYFRLLNKAQKVYTVRSREMSSY